MKRNVRVPDFVAEQMGLSVNKSRQYKLTEEQITERDRLILLSRNQKREFVETQKKLDKNGKQISSIEKLQSKPIDVPKHFEIVKISTSKTTGQQWVQYAPPKENEQLESINFDDIIQRNLSKLKDINVKSISEDGLGFFYKTNDFDTITYSDTHIGMDTNKHGTSMYAEKWNKESILNTCDEIVQHTLYNQKSKTLIVDDLGDFLDGYNEQTTRQGHKLPQNMTNSEVYDLGLEFKLRLCANLQPFYEKIIFNNINNDNHSGDFAYFVNSAFKQITEMLYDNVEVNNPRTFISHYIQGDVCFLISHGKDDKALKFGFKPHLDTKQIEKIDQYIKRHNLYGKAKRYIFKKGDSHQALFDLSGSDDFDYFNYPACSPSSEWVQTNFKKGRRGFVFESFKGVNSTQNIKFL